MVDLVVPQVEQIAHKHHLQECSPTKGLEVKKDFEVQFEGFVTNLTVFDFFFLYF
jgi:hypothetical protein